MSQFAIWWAVRVLRRVPPSALLNGETTPPVDPTKVGAPSRWAVRVGLGSLVLAVGLGVMGPFMPPGEPQAGTFFGSGAMLLTAGLAFVWGWMKRPRHRPVTGHGPGALARLGARNATRNPTRSLLTAGLLAAAAFLLVAVESFRREPEKDFPAAAASRSSPRAMDLCISTRTPPKGMPICSTTCSALFSARCAASRRALPSRSDCSERRRS
jgi:hypothetical protein